MKTLEILEPEQQGKNYTLTLKARKLLALQSRKVLIGIFRLARNRARRKGAYFWRQVKMESWRLLTNTPPERGFHPL